LITDNAPDSKDLNLRNKNGLTAMTIATLSKNSVAVRRLRLAGANPNIADLRGNTPLHYAAFYGDVVTLSALATRFGDDEVRAYGVRRAPVAVDLDLRNCEGKTPLLHAVERGHSEAVRMLVNLGCKPNLTENCAGRTALHVAVELGNFQCIVELLKSSNIDVNACTYAGRTPLDCIAHLKDDVREKVEHTLKANDAVCGEASDSESSTDESDADMDMDL